MKKRFIAALLALVLSFAFTTALAADTRIESLEYKGYGVIKVEFARDCNWYPDAVFTLTGDAELPLTITPFAGEEEDAYLYAPEIISGGAYRLSFTLGSTEQVIDFTADTSLKFKINKSGVLNTKTDNDRCDFCRETGHDEDFCPQRVNEGDIPADLKGLAWYFDIDEFCERCGGFGHDDDRCPN